MSTLLARLGAGSFRHRIVVLLLWALVLGGVIGLARTADTQVSTSVAVDGTPAQEVLDQVQVELPEAAGTQGTVVFRAKDGRVDDGPATDAVVAALEAGVATGYVVDRHAIRADQEAELRARATETATEKTGEAITRQLELLSEGLRGVDQTVQGRSEDVAVQLAVLAAGQPPQLQPWQQEQLAGQGGPSTPMGPAQLRPALEGMQQQLDAQATQLAEIQASVAELLRAPVEQQLDGVVDLSAQVEQLTEADPAAAEMLRGSLDGEGTSMLTSGTDPRRQIEETVDEQVASVMDDLDQLQRGTSPAGVPLVVHGEQVPGVTVSQDGTIAVLQVQLTEQLDDLPPGAADEVVGALTAGAADAGLEAYPSDSLQPLEPPIGGHEALGLLVALLVLLLTLGSLLAAGLPILTALLGVGVGVGGAFGLSEYYHMTSTTPVLALMLGLAVGIDYALFILFKQRRLILDRGMSAREATATAVGTAGSAVLFAGLTVIVALLGLLVLDIGFVTTMAVAAAATVGVSVLVSLPLLPALLGLVGERIVSRRAREGGGVHRPAGSGAAHRWARIVTARPWLVVVGVVALLGLAAVPAADMRLGMPGGSSAAVGSPERLNADLTAQALGPGAEGPLLVTVERPGGAERDLDQIRATLHHLAQVDGVADAALRGTNEDGTLEIYAVTPEAGPMAASTEDLVHTLREPGVVAGVDQVGVTGLTAINIDLSQRLAEAVPVYLAVVVVLALVILLLVFRSLVIPIVATLGFLLTVGASFGLTTAVFGTAELGWLAGVDRPGVVLSFLPIMATGILYGLAMDYQVFLTTAMREAHVHGSSGHGAVVEGFAHASRVVVAAAVIMVSVFAVFVLTDDPIITQFGFALALGVLVDAFLVRMTLMPAVLHAVGDAAWWLPRWLDRLLPALDVEGSRLERAAASRPHAGPETAEDPTPEPVVHDQAVPDREGDAAPAGDVLPVRS